MDKIPLETRLSRLDDGNFSDPAYGQSVIKNMAQTPIKVYLNGFDDELSWILEELNIPKKRQDSMLYRDIAVRISRHKDKEFVKKAVQVMAKPLHYRLERVIENEKNTTWKTFKGNCNRGNVL